MHTLPTKLNRPSIDNRWIARPRLPIVLDGALNQKLTLISAQPGNGKTTLVAQWRVRIAVSAVYLSLNEHDRDPDRFIRYLIAGVRRDFPEFGLDIESLILLPTLPPPHYLADSLVSDLTALKIPLVIVPDDLHTFASEPVQAILIRMIQFRSEQNTFALLNNYWFKE
jgi:LuxR family maltose regulon positive regulatory protein